ncbi:MAG: hypothetical protein D6706_19370 [Chloroflexi bacterium]|nr:MAG: hypothetical protein D6706_19370 [Chloroflexota bacterium]
MRNGRFVKKITLDMGYFSYYTVITWRKWDSQEEHFQKVEEAPRNWKASLTKATAKIAGNSLNSEK